MTKLKTLYAKIVKKTVSINKVKDYLSINPNDILSSEMREMLARYRSDREKLQLEFDNEYKNN